MRRGRVKHPVYRDGRVHILDAMCATCIFRPGNLMHLQPGRVDQMVEDCTRKQSAIPCHETLGRDGRQQFGGEAVCHGFYKLHATGPLQIAERLGMAAFVPASPLQRRVKPSKL